MKNKPLMTAFIVLAIGVMMVVAACSSASSTTTATTSTPPTTTTVSTPPPTTTTTTSAVPTTTTPPPTTATTTTSAAPTTTTPPPTTTTTTTSATPTTTTATTTTSASGPTYQTLSSSGQTQYSSTCAVCHGPDGGGTDICPVVLWGSGTNLGSYNGVKLFTDAQGMLNYMSKSMPLTAPGSLSSQQYNELLAFILLKAGKVSPSTVFDQSHLSSISIP